MKFSLGVCPPEKIDQAFQLFEDEVENMGSPSVEAFARQYLKYIQALLLPNSTDQRASVRLLVCLNFNAFVHSKASILLFVCLFGHNGYEFSCAQAFDLVYQTENHIFSNKGCF